MQPTGRDESLEPISLLSGLLTHLNLAYRKSRPTSCNECMRAVGLVNRPQARSSLKPVVTARPRMSKNRLRMKSAASCAVALAAASIGAAPATAQAPVPAPTPPPNDNYLFS